MKKEIVNITFLLLFISSVSFSQKFSYKKIFSGGYSLKLKGVIIVNDSVIYIEANNVPAEFKVIKTVDAGFVKQFKVETGNEDTEMRITFNNPKISTKEMPKMLMIETKDNFTNTNSTIIYYLTDFKD
jgi:hypothetical protein